MKSLGLKNLSAEKRKQLFSVALITAMILAGLGFGLIKHQFSVLAGIKARRASAENKLQEMDRLVQRAPVTEEELAVTSKQLEAMENKMAARDVYSWVVTALRQFRKDYQEVDIPQVTQPSIGDMTLLPGFPYRQATLKVNGTATFYNFGKFLADFENDFPHVRVVNLEITPASVANEKGLLTFQFDLVTLVNPNPS